MIVTIRKCTAEPLGMLNLHLLRIIVAARWRTIFYKFVSVGRGHIRIERNIICFVFQLSPQTRTIFYFAFCYFWRSLCWVFLLWYSPHINLVYCGEICAGTLIIYSLKKVIITSTLRVVENSGSCHEAFKWGTNWNIFPLSRIKEFNFVKSYSIVNLWSTFSNRAPIFYLYFLCSCKTVASLVTKENVLYTNWQFHNLHIHNFIRHSLNSVERSRHFQAENA